MTAKLLCMLALAALLVGCDLDPGTGAAELSPADAARQEKRGVLRRAYFVECLSLLPAGPQSSKYNDWDEVVEACDQTAYYQSNQAIK